MRCQQGHTSFKGQGKELFQGLSSSFWQPLMFLGLEMANFSLCLFTLSVPVSEFPLFIRTPVMLD